MPDLPSVELTAENLVRLRVGEATTYARVCAGLLARGEVHTATEMARLYVKANAEAVALMEKGI